MAKVQAMTPPEAEFEGELTRYMGIIERLINTSGLFTVRKGRNKYFSTLFVIYCTSVFTLLVANCFRTIHSFVTYPTFGAMLFRKIAFLLHAATGPLFNVQLVRAFRNMKRFLSAVSEAGDNINGDTNQQGFILRQSLRNISLLICGWTVVPILVMIIYSVWLIQVQELSITELLLYPVSPQNDFFVLFYFAVCLSMTHAFAMGQIFLALLMFMAFVLCKRFSSLCSRLEAFKEQPRDSAQQLSVGTERIRFESLLKAIGIMNKMFSMLVCVSIFLVVGLSCLYIYNFVHTSSNVVTTSNDVTFATLMMSQFTCLLFTAVSLHHMVRT